MIIKIIIKIPVTIIIAKIIIQIKFMNTNAMIIIIILIKSMDRRLFVKHPEAVWHKPPTTPGSLRSEQRHAGNIMIITIITTHN